VSHKGWFWALYFFLVYINDVLQLDLSLGARLVLYADDMLLYKPVRDAEDLINLQSDIDKISHWTRENFLTLNTAKCKSMLITRKRRCSLSNQFCLTLQSVPLDRVYLFKYLGVLISHNGLHTFQTLWQGLRK